MGVSPQVIYKKFNIPCPLEDQHHNITPIADMNKTRTLPDDFCEAKSFTINSQVRGKPFTFPASSLLC